jgi:hypothetical protein
MLADMAARTYAMEAVADLGALLADAGKSDIRLEAAVAKLWNTDVAWEIADNAMQIRGGRGYETAASLASRGEAPIPLERVLRDLRINKIFEGSSQIMRLFIAREALDTHLKAAGDAVMPDVPLGRRLAAMVRAGLFYAAWYPSRWLGWGRWPQYAEFGPLAGHVRWLERTSRRLARQQFHLMMRYQAGLERRQAQLFRCVDIGTELFVMAATCVRAERDRSRAQSDATAAKTPVEMADLFCRHSRRKVENLFRAIEANDDEATYRAARGVLDQRYLWLEEGILGVPTEAAAAELKREVAAAGS